MFRWNFVLIKHGGRTPFNLNEFKCRILSVSITTMAGVYVELPQNSYKKRKKHIHKHSSNSGLRALSETSFDRLSIRQNTRRMQRMHTVTQYIGLLSSRSVLSKYRRVSRYTRKCSFIYAHKKSMAFQAPTFTKITKVEQQYVHITYDKFHIEFYFRTLKIP
jgi:hypothetical protein